jgi:Zn-dependent protease with chaperone function
MKSPTIPCISLAVLLLAAGLAGADAPPGNLDQMLQSEPINAANWSKWSPRLREWSGEHYEAALPAFRRAVEFVKGQQKDPTGARPGLPKNLEKDPVAWMLLAAAYLDDPSPKRGPVAVARSAAEAARKSMAIDKDLARSHFLLCRAWMQEQLTPPDKGGPARPDSRRLADAFKELQEARALDPRGKWLSAAETGNLALQAQKWDDAEGFLRQALKDNPTDANLARSLAHAITEGGPFRKRTEPATAAVKQLVDQFPGDGGLVSYYARALAQDNRKDDAIAQLAEARKLGTDPAGVIDPKMVKDLDDTQSRKLADEAKRKADEARRKADDEKRKTEMERQKAEFDKRLADEEARRKADEAKRQADEAKRQKAEADENERKRKAAALQKAAADKRKAESDRRARVIPDALGTLFWWVVVFTIFYLVVMGLMALTGLLLARRTSGAGAVEMLGTPPEQLAASGQVARTRHETLLTRFYLVALLTALVLFYVSLPFVFIGLLLVFLLVLVIGMLVRKDAASADVHGALLRASGGGMGAVFKAIFARTGWGVEKDRDDCPKLWKAIDEVAQRVDTEAPDQIFISPGATYGVYQEGRGPFGVFGGRKRVLILGLCVMNFLSISELKAILAHEFAHYSHADTFWNRFLFQVTLSLRTAMREMARTGGVFTWVNPFFWFFWLYSKTYSMLSAGFSRSREFLADRMACSQYGSDVFARGLRKVITDGSHFEGTVYSNIVRLLRQKKAYVNMYLAFRKFRDEGMTEEERIKLHKKLLEDEPSMFASHPTFQERMEAAKPLPRAKKTEDAPSLQLFEQPEKVEQELTDYLTNAVNRYIQG